MLLTVGVMLYSRSLELICLTLLRLYAHRLPTPHSLYPLPWAKLHHSTHFMNLTILDIL